MTLGLGGLAAELVAEARARGHRRLLVLAGEAQWARGVAQNLLADTEIAHEDVLWAGASSMPDACVACAPGELVGHIGHEYGSLVLDAHAGLDPDGLGAAVGTVRGGGLVVLLTPPLAAWPEVPDPQAERLAVDGWGVEAVTGRFLERLAAKLRGDPCAVVIEQDRPLPQVTPLPAASPTSPPADPDCLTVDQEQAVAAVERVITGHRRRPTVLTADRGRGKSAALGIAAARLMAARGIDVVVTGPHRGAVAAVLRHAAARLGVPVHRGRVQTANGATLRFLLPDEVRQASESPDLVLVDEAAALPATVLTALLERFSRIVFATTVHGYEGTGRGFTLRFRSVLDERTPRWREVVLREPVRWRSGDPVEAWLFDALLLDAALPAVPETNSEQLGVEALDRARLAGDDALLRDVFGLLIHAHYRTRPLDLRNLLDGPNLQVIGMRQGGALCGVALVAGEGGFSEAVATAIWAGQRRPRGHLLSQSLASHVGVAAGASVTARRVMRIAVHPQRQGRGLGSHLLGALERLARDEGAPLLGASFGATPALLRFWSRAGFQAVHLGMRRDGASGTHSVVMVRALVPPGEGVVTAARERMARDLPTQLADPLASLEPQLARMLLRDLDMPQPDAQEWHDAVGFAHGHRAFEVSLAALRRIALAALCSDRYGSERLTEPEMNALVTRVVQGRAWAEAAAASGEAGRPGVVRSLRAAFARLIAAAAPSEARSLADRLDAGGDANG